MLQELETWLGSVTGHACRLTCDNILQEEREA